MADFTFELHSPITEEEWDIITDVDLDNTPSVIFHTKHGKDVEYVKAVRCNDCKYGVLIPKLNGVTTLFCNYNGATGEWRWRTEADYCSRGERKDDSD